MKQQFPFFITMAQNKKTPETKEANQASKEATKEATKEANQASKEAKQEAIQASKEAKQEAKQASNEASEEAKEPETEPYTQKYKLLRFEENGEVKRLKYDQMTQSQKKKYRGQIRKKMFRTVEGVESAIESGDKEKIQEAVKSFLNFHKTNYARQTMEVKTFYAGSNETTKQRIQNVLNVVKENS